MKSYNPFENIKQDKPIHIIGDALKPGKAQDAIHGAYIDFFISPMTFSNNENYKFLLLKSISTKNMFI
jgi:hypothetical protein